jgi:hypothetical protein
VIAFIKRILARLDFNYERQQKEWHDYLNRRDADHAQWLAEQAATSKARRLAEIARQRDALKEKLAKAVRDKKARAPIYQALRALSVAELRVEMGEK